MIRRKVRFGWAESADGKHLPHTISCKVRTCWRTSFKIKSGWLSNPLLNHRIFKLTD